ncbi:hypothetical protein [Haloarchaeobius sp. HRN-SO-5]|uniref:hypothetical protein n=1 Tax=Haloarchaeobius sp. HRN-SO-5 TaxID=3446118 RepID=UPI003EBB9D98
MEFDPDRPRGLLSRADREYLLGMREMDHEQSKRNAEARIRNRVTEGITDFYLLIRNLERKDRRQIFEKGMDDPTFRYGLIGMTTFTYMGMKETGMDFAHVLEPGVTRAEEAYAAEGFDSTVDVDVTFEVDVSMEATLDSVAERLRAGEPLAPDEFLSVMGGDEDVLESVEAVTLDLKEGSVGMDDEEFVERVAGFLDGAVTWESEDRATVTVGEDVGST